MHSATKIDMDASNKRAFEIEREKANAISDDELSEILLRRWEDDDFPTEEWPEKDRDEAYAKLSSKIFAVEDFSGASNRRRVRPSFASKAMKYAAAIFLPALLLSAIYFYYVPSPEVDCVSMVRVGEGEMATIDLPDGSEVKLNSGSVLSYNPYSFSKVSREVKLQGEAFFSVQSDKSHPFTVSCGEVLVKVLGTKFNVRSSAADPDITVLLTEGSVEMQCRGVQGAIVLKPWQMAVFDKEGGVAEVVDVDRRCADIAWLNKEMVFKDKSFAEVASAIEKKYGVVFENSVLETLPNDKFTGTLPSDDLSATLNILEDVYGVRFSLNARQITLNQK